MIAESKDVLVLSNERDFAADAVIGRLHELEVPVRRLNAEQLHASAPPWTLEDDARYAATIWWRQALPEPRSARSVAEADEDAVLADQWRAFLSAFDHPDTRWVNPLWQGRAAEDKIRQLRVARDVGMSVPPTLVTNSAAEAAAFRSAQKDCVVKTLRGAYFGRSDQSFMFTQALTQEMLDLQSHWREQPLIVQKRIAPRTDIRCFVVDGRLVGAGSATANQHDDWRLAPHEVSWRPFDPPAPIADQAVAYSEALGLNYCALDFAADVESIWFLEGNQAGEFAWLDQLLALGVANAIADALARP
jgi:glutathione synthase/RimK-type ligase-like ATP-grasp enzyme